jgi:NAD(P)-dependent dehydrogenase (short-subunit alcohol dehydrogenase family)/acyl carrier protein
MNQVSAADVSLNWLHLDHVGALVRCCIRDIFVGNTQIHAATQLFLHDPLRWLDWIETHRVTYAWAPNFGLSLFNERLRSSTPTCRDLSFVRSILSVAEPIVPKVAQEFAANMQRFGIGPEKLHAAWGMSETSAAVVFSHDFLSRLPSPDYPFTEVGSPVPGLSIRIVDNADRIIAEGDTGNVQIAGAMIISRYFANKQATETAYTSDGWFRTGDLGFLRDGKLTITGRKKDTIIINGRNIASHEIESVIDTISGVTRTFTAAIAVRERARNTDQLVVFFHTELEQLSDQRLLLERILERVVAEVGIRPACVIAVDRESIPKSSAGKILRSRLRDSFLEGDFDAHIKHSDLLLENERTFPGWFLKRSWRRKQAPPGGQLPGRSGITIIFQDSLGLAQALQARLKALGHSCLLVRPGNTFLEENTSTIVIDPGEADHYRLLFNRVRRDHHAVRSILHLWAYTPHQEQVAPDTLDNALDLWFVSLAFLAKALHEQLDLEETLTIHVCATDTQPVSEEDHLCCEKGLALGLVQTIPQEQPFLDWRHCDLADQGVQEAADLIMNELVIMTRDREVAYRRGMRFVPVLEELTSSSFSANDQSDLHIQPGGLYLITGGFGEIGLQIAQTLIEDKGARLLLVGRTPLPSQSSSLMPPDGKRSGGVQFTKTLHRYQALQASHPYIEYRAVDICDTRALMDAVEDLESRWQTSLCGVFHLARVTDDKLTHDQTRNGLLNTLQPKVQGTLSVGRLLDTRPDAFFVGFSSVSSTLGTYRMAAYASGNRFIDNFCVQRRNSKGRAARSLAWSIWEEVGAERSYQMRDLSLKRGLFTLPTDKGIACMFAAMQCQNTGVIIGLDPGNRYIRQFMDGPPEAINELCANISCAESGAPGRQTDNTSIQDRLGNTVACQLADAESLRSKKPAFAGRFASLSPELVQYRAELEKIITAIWEKLLQVDCVEPEDNFFDLGGHSILAMQFVVELARQTDEHIELSVLFGHPVLRDLVDKLVIHQAGVSQRPDHQSPSMTELSQLLKDHYQTLRLALQQQFSQILKVFPVERYVEQIRQLPALAGYVQIGVICNRTMDAIRKMAGDDLEPLYNRLAIVHAIQNSLADFGQQEFPRDIEDLFVEWFYDMLAGTSWTEDNFFRLDYDPFLKDMAVCTGRMIPVGGAWTIELSGISRRTFFSGNPNQLLARIFFLSSRARAFKPFYQIHMALRFADRFNENEREASYLRIAAMLRANPGVKGLIGSSWYLDPALKEISPELSYLQNLPENNGALIFPQNTPKGAARGALAGSSRRTQLCKEGKYKPKNAFIIWPRTALLGWAGNHVMNNSARKQG